MSTWNDTNRFPHNNFIWKGIDGSEVYACVPPTHFITWNMPSQIQENWEAYQDKNQGGQTMSMFGYGDGGSGCTEEMIEVMHRFDKLSVMPKTEHISGQEFLEKNLKDNPNLAKWDGELYLEMHRGTFTTKSKMKRYNRQLEYKLREAEIISTLRYLKGEVYPHEEIRDIYKKLLINQFHDILPGSHITPVYRDAMADYEEIEKRVDKIIGDGNEYFNSLNFPRTHLTFINDENGDSIRYGKKGNWVIPKLSALSSGKIKKENYTEEWATLGDRVITPFYEIKFNDDGSIESLYDRELEREWADGEFNKLKLYKDNPGVYDAWDILPNYTDREVEIKVISPLEVIEKNPEVVSFACTLATEKSTWRRIIRVFRQSRGIETENIVDWNEKHVLAKAQFDCNILTRKAVCDTSAGFTERETHRNTTWQQARFEVCHHKWVDMAETDGGIALINDSKYGVGLLENSMSLSLLRATIRPDVTSDIGHHEFSYMIYPHGDDFVKAEINNIAFEYNVPLSKADFSIENKFSGLYMQTMKLSEKGDMIVIRLSEQNGKRGKIRLDSKVRLLNLLEDTESETDTIEYKPFEIITIGLTKQQLQ
jgi:alpha-mannosidase